MSKSDILWIATGLFAVVVFIVGLLLPSDKSKRDHDRHCKTH